MRARIIESAYFGSNLRISQNFLVLIVCFVVLLSRLPFLIAGYGNDWDNWRLANTARSIATTGEYSFSRVPGHPLQEIAYSFLWWGGPVALNGTVAVASALAVLFFALSLRLAGCKDYLLASLAFAFTPVIFINSTISDDYVLALAFILASLYCVLTAKPLLAGILLGAAIGCRITSGAMLIPLCPLFYRSGTKQLSRTAIVRFAFATCVVSFVVYLPVFLKYGFSLLDSKETPHVPLLGIIKLGTLDVWGMIGVLALLVGMISLVSFAKISQGESSVPATGGQGLVLASVVTICLYTIIYFAYVVNYKPAFLIPAVPFVILVLGRVLRRPVFVLVCVALLSSRFLFGLMTGSSMKTLGGTQFFDLREYSVSFNVLGDQIILDPLNGPFFLEYSRRVKTTEYIQRVLNRGQKSTEKAVVLCGRWLLMIEANLPSKSQSQVQYFETLSPEKLQEYREQGYRVYFLIGQQEYDVDADHVDLLDYGGAPFVPEFTD